jgi:hypothetical protein
MVHCGNRCTDGLAIRYVWHYGQCTVDGLAITWASALYGSDPKQISLGAAWILWGVGAFTASAFFEAYRLGPK